MAKTGQNKPPKPSAKAGKGRRIDLHVGDIVALRSHIEHMTGAVGEVIKVIDRDHVVVRCMGAHYKDYDNRMWVALTYKPTGVNLESEPWKDHHIWVRKRMYSHKKLPPKVVKPPKPVTTITGTDALLQALSSDDPTKHDAVHVVLDQNNGSTP